MNLKNNTTAQGAGEARSAEESVAAALSAPQSDLFQDTVPARRRRGRMAGGIQPGTVAASAGSKGLESDLLASVKRAFVVFSKMHPALTWRAEWKGQDLEQILHFADEPDDGENVPDAAGRALAHQERMIGCKPDGGIILLHGVPIAAFEAKYQGDEGNAIERWYKNRDVFANLRTPFKPLYLTVVTGEGAAPGAVLSRTAQLALRIEGRRFDKVYLEGLCMFRSVEPFTPQRLDAIVTEVFTKALRTAEKHAIGRPARADLELVG